MRTSNLLVVAVASLLTVVSVKADVIVRWDNDDLAASSSSAAADTVHSDVTASSLTAGGGVNTAIGWPNTFGAFGNGLQGTVGGSITDGDYFSFTVTPDVGMEADYDNLFVRLSINTGDTGVDNITTFYLFSEQTGFTSGDEIDSFSLNRTAGSSAVISDTYTFDLSGVSELQDVSSGSEFRLYAVQTSGSGNRMAVGVPFNTAGGDDLVLNGTVSAVPEPASLSLMGLAMLAYGYRRVRFAAVARS